MVSKNLSFTAVDPRYNVLAVNIKYGNTTLNTIVGYNPSVNLVEGFLDVVESIIGGIKGTRTLILVTLMWTC